MKLLWESGDGDGGGVEENYALFHQQYNKGLPGVSV
jgi:hypothetical protein